MDFLAEMSRLISVSYLSVKREAQLALSIRHSQLRTVPSLWLLAQLCTYHRSQIPMQHCQSCMIFCAPAPDQVPWRCPGSDLEFWQGKPSALFLSTRNRSRQRGRTIVPFKEWYRAKTFPPFGKSGHAAIFQEKKGQVLDYPIRDYAAEHAGYPWVDESNCAALVGHAAACKCGGI